jgi:hypothetical protein
LETLQVLGASPLSRGPGRVERAIEAVFRKYPQESFTTDQLVMVAYPQLRSFSEIEKKHRVAVLRATRNICPRLWWGAYLMREPGGPLLFVYQLDEAAYLRGRTRAVCPGWSATRIAENIAVPLNQFWRDNYYAAWRREHAIAVLQAAGDPKGAALARTLAEERRVLRAPVGVSVSDASFAR